MRVTCSAAAQNRRVGIRSTRSRRTAIGQFIECDHSGIAKAIERGWQYFWRRRGLVPPQVARNVISVQWGSADTGLPLGKLTR